MKKQGGFTLVEVTIILLVLVILSSIMLPQLGNYNRLARYVKVREDVGALCASIDKMLKEMWMSAFYGDPANRKDPIGLLVGPGRKPDVGTAGNGNKAMDVFDWRLSAPNISGSGGALTVTTDGTLTVPMGVPVVYGTDLLANHLQQNNPGGVNPGGYPTFDRMMDGIDGTFFGWKGPYFDELTADPWGNRYAVNSFGLHSPGSGNHSTAVVCYSAGPDGRIDTAINQPVNDRDMDGFNGWKFGGDDQGAILSAGGPF